MKRLFFYFSVLLLTFFVGLAVNSALLFFTEIPNIEAVDNNGWTKPQRLLRGVQIEYKWTLQDKYGNSGIFVVTNGTDKSIYYSGYEKNSHVVNWTRQNGIVEYATELPCFNGVERQELKPEETAIFEIPLPKNRQPFEAGFLFTIDNEHQSFWVKVDKQSKFSATSSK